MAAVASMERNGTAVDDDTLSALRANWVSLMGRLTRASIAWE